MLAALTSVILGLAPSPAPEAPGDTSTDASAPIDETTPEPEASPETEPDASPEPEPEASPEPAASEARPTPPMPSGGFGEVGEVAVESRVQTPPPSPSRAAPVADEDSDQPRFELTGRAEIGFAQTDVGNAAGLDHNGLFLRAHLVLLPWVSKRRVIAAGIGGAYSYVGLNHAIDPALGFSQADSSAQQQAITASFDLLARPHPEWFSVHLSPMIGLGWYANAELLAADRPARIRSDEYGFAAGGSLALCTAWTIACVTGGSQILLGIASRALEAVEVDPPVIRPWGWHIALGVDIARIVMRANGVPR